MATPPDFSVGQVLTAAHMNAVGLWLVKTQTIGSGVSTVTVSNAFSADFDAYRIVVSNVNHSTTTERIRLQLNNATTAGYYGSYQYVNYATNVFATASDTNAAQFGWVGSAGSGNFKGQLICDIVNPYLTCFTSIVAGPIIYNNFNGTYTGIQDTNTSHTGFILSPATGTISGGTIRVYGYRN